MSTPEGAPVDQMRWYTRALKIPRLIGKLPSGERIKGGPYRQSQLFTVVAIVILGHLTMRWWGFGGFFTNWGSLLIVAGLAGAAAKYAPIGTVNPVVVAGGAARMVGGTRAARWCGQRLQTRPHGPAAARFTLTHALTGPTAAPEPTAPAPAAPPPRPAVPPADHARTAPAEKLAALLANRSHQPCP